MATQYARLFDPTTQFQTKSGALNTAGLLRVYLDDTDDLAEVFDDGMSIIRQPVVLDNNGRAPGLFVDSAKTYRLEVYDRNGSLMFTIRSMNSTGGGGSGGGNYYPGDIFIDIDQEMREISLKNLKRLRADGETIVETETDEEVVFSVNPDIIGDYIGSDTVEIDSDGTIRGKYEGGYGIEIDGNVVKEAHHRLISTDATQYNYCKVFEFTWKQVYGRGLCVFTATNHNGDYVKFVLQLTRTDGADYTVVRPYVVAASPSMVSGAFVERLEVHTDGYKSIGYLKLNGFVQSQFWLDWEGISDAGEVVFTPQLTNATEGELTWIRSVLNSDVFYPQTNADNKFQKKLTAGDNINITSDGVISAEGGIPSASSVDSDKVLTVGSDGNPQWSNPPKKPVVRSNVAFSATSTTETTSTWTSPTISSPSGGNAMMIYSIYVQGPNLTESDQWDVKINGSNWTTGIRGNFSSYACVVPASGVTFTVTGPYGIVAPRISYVLFQEWS